MGTPVSLSPEPQVAVVLVHYHAARAAVAALLSLRRDLERASAAPEWVVVDNGSDADEAARLAALDWVKVVDPGRNLGYAGGLGLGVSHTRASRLLLMNPDVLVRPGCAERLLAALDSDAAAVGPRLFWDETQRVLLPPTEQRTRLAELLTALASHGGGAARAARARWRRHARRHWTSARPVVSESLSGALLLVRRSAWEQVGPFDPGFQLYFEESDWLRRAGRHGLRSLHVPAAEAVHHWGESAAREPRASQWFAESCGKFRRRHYGLAWSRLLERLERGSAAPPPVSPDPARFSLGARGDMRGWWVEISPTPRGIPAGAERLEAPTPAVWEPPAEAWGRLPPGRYPVRLVSPSGREVVAACLERPGAV